MTKYIETELGTEKQCITCGDYCSREFTNDVIEMEPTND